MCGGLLRRNRAFAVSKAQRTMGNWEMSIHPLFQLTLGWTAANHGYPRITWCYLRLLRKNLIHIWLFPVCTLRSVQNLIIPTFFFFFFFFFLEKARTTQPRWHLDNTIKTLRRYRCREIMASYRSREEILILREESKGQKISKKVKTGEKETHGGSGLGGRGRKSAWE